MWPSWGGFTGLWSAIHLKEADPAADVIVAEQIAGYGASGRNGGFAMTRSAVRGLLTVSNGPEQDVRIRQDLAAERLGLDDFVPLTGRECQDLVDSERLRMGHFERDALLLDPAALAWGLRLAAQRRGVRIFEQTPAAHLASTDGRPEGLTPDGTRTPGSSAGWKRPSAARNSRTSPSTMAGAVRSADASTASPRWVSWTPPGGWLTHSVTRATASASPIWPASWSANCCSTGPAT